jgi:hypothetical protein
MEAKFIKAQWKRIDYIQGNLKPPLASLDTS